MLNVPLGEWLPDMPDLDNPGSPSVINAIPVSPDSYGPFNGLVATGSGIVAQALGAFLGTDNADATTLYAGDATSLYSRTGDDTAFTNISQMGGYAVPTGERWQFVQFGELIIATQIGNNIQTIDVGATGLFSDLSSGAPKARYMAVIKDWVMVLNTEDSTSGVRPARLWWPAIGDPTTWPTPGTLAAAAVQSDYQDVNGVGAGRGVVGPLGNADGAAFFEHGVFRIMYVGAPDIFSILPVEGARGTPAAGSIAQWGESVYYLGEDGFYAFDGINSEPIGANKIDKFIYGDLNSENFGNVWSAIDPKNRLYIMAYPSIAASSTTWNRMVAFHWPTGRWGYITGNSGELLFSSATFGYTLEDLDALYGVLEDVPFPLDSREWVGDAIQLAAFNASHNLAAFNGITLPASMTTTEAEITEGHVSRVTMALPLIDGGNPSIAVSARNRLIDTPMIGAASPINNVGLCPLDASGRYMRATVTTLAGDSWKHMKGILVPDDAVVDLGIQ